MQGTTQSNDSQVIAVYNDAQAAGLTLNVTLLYNTFVGPSGGRAALVHLSNADGTVMSAELDDNLLVGTTAATHVEMTSVGQVTGTHNWLPTGADATGLQATVFGATPGFTNAAQGDYTLAAGSTAIGAALSPATGAPDHEYYRDETVTRMYRLRASAKDVGAFESTTTGPGAGPTGGVTPGQDAGAGGSGAGGAAGRSGTGGAAGGGGTNGSGGGAAAGSGGTAPSTSGGGCSCRVAPRPDAGAGVLAAVALALAALRRRANRAL